MTDFHGLPTASIANGLVRIDYLKQGALRLVRLMLVDSPNNLLVEVPGVGWQTPNGYYRLLGGHRFWVAPECIEITYLPEPAEIEVEKLPSGVRLAQPTDARSGLQKIIEIYLPPGQAAFRLKHTLVNHGEHAVTAAAWAISQFRLGGIAALPQPADLSDPGGYQSNRSLVFWPYTRLSDPRLRWMEKYLMIHAQCIEQPCKVGYYGSQGWSAYLLDEVLIRKEVSIQRGVQYPDMNSALQLYIDHRFIELESTSPLVRLQPGESISHEEGWSLEKVSGIQDEQTLAEYLDQRG